MPLVLLWFRAFVWTQLLEQLAAGYVLRTSLPRARRISVIAVANLASHPAVWFVFPELGAGLRWPHALTLFVSEAWAFGLEAWIYWLFLGSARWRLAVTVSVIANGLSFGAGYALRALGWV
jgi:hypothetical protein